MLGTAASRARTVFEVFTTVGLVAAVVWIVARGRPDLEALARATPALLALTAVLTVTIWATTAVAFRWMVSRLAGRASWLDIFSINVAAGLLNHLPGKPGTAWRAVRLKQLYGVDYAQYVGLGAVHSIANLLVAVVALASALLVLRSQLTGSTALAMSGLIGVGCLVALLLPWPRPSGSGRVATFVRRASEAKRSLTTPGLLIAILLLTILSLALAAGRFAAAFQGIDGSPGWLVCLALGAASSAALRLTITPAGLGVHELVAGAAAELLGLSLSTGVLAASLVRLVVLGLYLVIGGVALASRRSKSALLVEAGEAVES